MEPDLATPAGQPPPNTRGALRPLIWIAAIPALAIAYYYGIALPSYDRARLDVERQQVAAEQKRADLAAKDVTTRKEMLDGCLQKASDDYFNYLRLNGSESADGKISAPQAVETAADTRRRADREFCVRQFGTR